MTLAAFPRALAGRAAARRLAARRVVVRGYLLAEAVVAGAVLASAIAISFALIAQGRSDVTYSAKRAVAAQLGRQKADEAASGITCTAVASGAAAAGAQYPGFSLTWTTIDVTGIATSTPPITAGKLCRVIVTVTYPTAKGGPEDNARAPAGDGIGDVTFMRMWKVL